ncbi:carbamoyltransferase HypF [Roseovarius autotrophicus]|uniref:carbamoyltransferase HypF n=1 Tax=Roseovarius autotrophicus TaxID=2824121 RepID=UPI001B397C2E|nr:carbamoyltransferase HypF [Roseovarius autotrophicus]
MIEGWRIRVRGQVQGVGFRPFIWQLAREMGLRGRVLNDAEGVLIEAAGEGLLAFVAAIPQRAPPLARVDEMRHEAATLDLPEGFEIAASGAAGAETRVTPDAASCAACVEEIFRPGRRQGYAFTNCTHCGPRFTILRGLPYDRARTTMAEFPLCDACHAEYETPADRRFHAQPVACPDCGPRLWLEPGGGDAMAGAVAVLRAGGVLAIKGLGGFHLACDAGNAEAVTLLRARKHRPAKPFALMGGLPMIRAHCTVSEEEARLLNDPAAPIVLLRRAGAGLPEAVAPGQATLGWMLPYTPLHHLLIDAFGGPLVMTSGNLSGEPQVIGNAEAREKLGGFADAFLMHDREIARRLDDSVERAHPPMILRRARGRVPGTLPLPEGFGDAPQVVAYGGQMKAAICLVKNAQALLGHHLGALDEALSWEAFLQADADYAGLFEHRPALVACDLHPGYRATQHARTRGLPVVAVQHHHAHLASCLAENLWPLDGGPVAGIVLDGLGLGADGAIWGGEVLVGDYRDFVRHAWLSPTPLPGGDAANRDPWRNALARLDRAGMGAVADALLAERPLAPLRAAMRAGVNAPLSSSAGRLFDAFAAVTGFAGAQGFEGEAAMWLEALALRAPEGAGTYPITGVAGALDDTALWQAWHEDHCRGTAPEVMAWRFHAGLAEAFARAARAAVAAGEARAVALSGGCFQNALLQQMTRAALGDVPVMVHRVTPANDGGLALGQALVAAARVASA